MFEAYSPYGCRSDGWQIQSGTGIIQAVSQGAIPVCKYKGNIGSQKEGRVTMTR